MHSLKLSLIGVLGFWGFGVLGCPRSAESMAGLCCVGCRPGHLRRGASDARPREPRARAGLTRVAFRGRPRGALRRLAPNAREGRRPSCGARRARCHRAVVRRRDVVVRTVRPHCGVRSRAPVRVRRGCRRRGISLLAE